MSKTYTVTFEVIPEGMRHGPVAIDQGPQQKGFDLNGALAHACHLVQGGRQNVTIHEDAGHDISGDPLIACCSGQKTLTDDLQAT